MRDIADIILDVILALLIMYGAALGIVHDDPDDDPEALCVFPCEFPGPVYKLAVESEKYKYLKRKVE